MAATLHGKVPEKKKMEEEEEEEEVQSMWNQCTWEGRWALRSSICNQDEGPISSRKNQKKPDSPKKKKQPTND